MAEPEKPQHHESIESESAKLPTLVVWIAVASALFAAVALAARFFLHR